VKTAGEGPREILIGAGMLKEGDHNRLDETDGI
jgi:hypothetical protein